MSIRLEDERFADIVDTNSTRETLSEGFGMRRDTQGSMKVLANHYDPFSDRRGSHASNH